MSEVFKRFELKFKLNAEQNDLVRARIEQNMQKDAFCLGGKPYAIYSAYFDTRDYVLVRTSLSKPYYKEKLRLRSYGSSFDEERPAFLEIKKKIGGIVNKRRVTLSVREAMAFLENDEKPGSCQDVLSAQILDEIGYLKKIYPLDAKVGIRYERFAYSCSGRPDLRITLDQNITAGLIDAQCLNLVKERRTCDLTRQHEAVLEIKLHERMPQWLCEVLAETGLQRTSFSKYGCYYRDHIAGKKTQEDIC